MATESERRFLVSGEKFWELLRTSLGNPSHISQGYFSRETNPTSRVRLVNTAIGQVGERKAFFTVKGRKDQYGSGYEYEYEIPYEDGGHLFDQCPYKVTKWRYPIRHESVGEWVLDTFNADFHILEIEGTVEEITSISPTFCVREITGESAYYSNQMIAILGASNPIWKSENPAQEILKRKDDLSKWCIAQIEGQNYTDRELTIYDKNLIEMTVGLIMEKK